MNIKAGRMVLCLTAAAVLAWTLSGCGQRVEETEAQQTTATEVHTETETDAPVIPETEKATEETETETQKLITSVDYTSKDGSVKITLPDNTWKVTQDADEMRVFQSGSAAIINIVHASTETAMKNLSVQRSEESLNESLLKQYTDEDDFSVESFLTASVEDITIFRYVVKYNAPARMWAYSMTNAIVADDEAYVVTGTVTDENQALLEAVQKSVESFRVLNDEDFKAATGEVISGKTQTVTETTVVETDTASASELKSLTDYGTTVALVTTDTVNVRLQPGTDADILITLSGSVNVNVIGETRNWFKVSINGNTGYIRKDFLVYGTAGTEAETTATNETASGSGAEDAEKNTATTYGTSTTLYAASDANVRSGPGTDTAVINAVSGGAAVTVTGETDNWFIVSIGGVTGYISKALLTYDIPDSTTGGDTSNNTDSGDNNSSNNGNTGSVSSISGTVVSAGVETLTIAGNDGNTYTVYYGGANVTSSDGIYDGVYVSVSLDASRTSGDGTLYATSVSGN